MTIKIIRPSLMNATICNCNKYAYYLYNQKYKKLRIGTKNNIKFRSLLKFDLSSLPFFLTITHGSLNVFVLQSKLSNHSPALGAFQILSKWNSKNVTWKHQPLTSSCPADSTYVKTADCIPLTFDITSVIQEWFTNRKTNWGIMLKILDESCDNFLTIPGKRYADPRLWPFLELNIAAHEPERIVPLAKSWNVTALDVPQYTPSINVLIYDYSYIVFNSGANPAVAHLQVSPDNKNWQLESETKTVPPGTTTVSFVPNTIAKFARLCYQAQHPLHQTTLTVFAQGRSCN